MSQPKTPRKDDKDKGKEKVPFKGVLRQSKVSREELRKRTSTYVANFDRKMSFNIDTKETLKFKPGLFGMMVRKGFSELYNNPKLSDIVLILGDEKIPAHRTVLCVWSDTFRAMLDARSDWAESRLAELPVELEAENHPIFKMLLRYMYTGETDFITGDNILSIISLSNYYGIHSLKEICGELLGGLVNDDNLFYFLDIAENFDVKALEASCGEHLAANFTQLLDDDKLAVLKPSTWAEMLKSDNLKIRSEEQLFEAVLRYGETFSENPKQRDDVLNLILPCIRFPFMSGQYLVETVETDATISHLPIVKDLVHEALKYKVYTKALENSDNPRFKARAGFRWDPETCHSSISLSDSNLKCTCTMSAGWINVRGKEPLTPHNNYVEWTVSGSGSMMLGVVAGTCSNTGYAGQFSNGWTYYSPGQIYHNNSTPVTGTNYTNGDKVGVAYNAAQSQLVFYKNGAQSAVVSGVNPASSLYPIACFCSQNDSVTINLYAEEPGKESKKKKNN